MEIAPMKKYHNKVSDEKEATCNEDGYFRETCTNCDYLYEIICYLKITLIFQIIT